MIAASAWSSMVVPILVDGVLFARAHMRNPFWLPHAKLHCAMSFHAAIALGLAALLLLRGGERADRSSLTVAALCATAFWVGLVAAGLWPGTSYTFEGDPASYRPPPVVLGFEIDLNVALAVIATLLGWTGWWLATRPVPTTSSVTGRSR